MAFQTGAVSISTEQAATPTETTVPDDCPLPIKVKGVEGLLAAKWQKTRGWCRQIATASKTNGLDPQLVAAIIWWESGGDPLAYSSSGAVGLMQVMPKDGIASDFKCTNGPCFENRPNIAELEDAAFNIEFGTRMFAGLVHEYGSAREALVAYGPMNVGYYYADRILSLYETLKQ